MGAESDVKIKYFSSVLAKEVEWLWYPYIPFGKLTVVQGDPGDGKTTLILNIAALLSKGMPMPNTDIQTLPAVVLYQNSEDGIEDTVKPRLVAAGADCSRIAYIDEPINVLSLDSPMIESAIRKTGAKLIILDPLQAYLGHDNDIGRATDMRPLLQSLSDVADRTVCAILLVSHMNKTMGTKGLYRGLGSIDIASAARSILLVGRLKNDIGIRVMAHMKSSLAPEGNAIAFEIGQQSELRWIGDYDIKIDDLLFGTSMDDDSGKRGKAEDLIIQALEAGDQPCNEIYALCLENGIKKRTVDSAKREIGVKSIKKADGWYWSMHG